MAITPEANGVFVLRETPPRGDETQSRAIAWLSSGLSVVFGRAGHVVSSWFLARHLSDADFGAFLLAVATANTAVGILAYGLYASASHFVSEALPSGRADLSRAFWAILATAGILVGTTTGILAWRMQWITGSLMKAPHLAGVFTLLVPAITALALGRCAEGLLFGMRKFPVVATVKGIAATFGVTAMVVLANKWGWSGAIVGFALGAMGLCIGLSIAAGKRAVDLNIGRATPSVSLMLRIVRLVLFLSLTNMMVVAATWLGQVILTRNSGTAAISQFGPGNQLRNLLGILPGTLGAATIPFMSERYAQKGTSGLRDVATEFSLILLLVLGPACILLVGWSHEVLALLYGIRTAVAWQSANLLFLAILVQSPAMVMAYIIVARTEAIYGVWVNLAWASVFLFGAWWGVPRYGALGLAGAILAASVLQTPLCFLYLASRAAVTRARVLLPYAYLLFAAIGSHWVSCHGKTVTRLTLSTLLAGVGFVVVLFCGFTSEQRSHAVRFAFQLIAKRSTR